jgi:hypothetical protein
MPYVVLVLLLLVVAVVAFVVQKRAGQARARIEAGLAALDVQRQDKANYYGRETAGKPQPRSLGALALTPGELVFLQFVPEEEVRIPRTAITGVEIARSFLGKAQNRDLLVVTWEADGVDRAAFDVTDVHAWREELTAPGAGQA